MREFACHTTVILAQPRVSRLRAAVVYVLWRAWRAAADIVDFQMPVWRGPPLFLVSLYCSNNKKETYRELRSGRPNPWFSLSKKETHYALGSICPIQNRHKRGHPPCFGSPKFKQFALFRLNPHFLFPERNAEARAIKIAAF